jgi:hypothetical protein
MDNFSLDVVGEGAPLLESVLTLAFDRTGVGTHRPHVTARAMAWYQITVAERANVDWKAGLGQHDTLGLTTLVFSWRPHASWQLADRKPTGIEGPHMLPGLSARALLPFVHEWLGGVHYPPEPDIDGSVSKGWRVFTTAWGHVLADAYGICAIQPCWALHGK